MRGCVGGRIRRQCGRLSESELGGHVGGCVGGRARPCKAKLGGRSGRLKWEAKLGGRSGRPWETKVGGCGRP